MATETDITNWYKMSDSGIVSELGAILRQIRRQQNLTQEKLASKAGLSRSAIYEMENGKTATSLITIVQVLRALEQLQVFDCWKADVDESRIKTGEMAGRKQMRTSYKSSNNQKKEGNEWEWL